MFDKKIIINALIAAIIFAVLNKMVLSRILDKVPHLEEMLDES